MNFRMEVALLAATENNAFNGIIDMWLSSVS